MSHKLIEGLKDLGTLWEMMEFIIDYFFNTGMVKGGLEDTASDLIVKICAALAVSIIAYIRNLNSLTILSGRHKNKEYYLTEKLPFGITFPTHIYQ